MEGRPAVSSDRVYDYNEIAPETTRKTQLKRNISSRHMLMISLGGVIGTGLFLGSGYTINQAGPIGTILAYSVGALLVYLVMLCLGELSTAMPWTGSFHTYAMKFLGPSTGFVVAVMYWLTWVVALGGEFTAAGVFMSRWFPDVPVWIFSAVFIALIFLINAMTVKVFAETESWMAGIKVLAIVVFMALGLGAMFGLIPMGKGEPAPFFSNLTRDGWFPNGLGVVFSTMLIVNFAFSGTEIIAVTAGEAQSPQETVPRAVRAVSWRLAVFFIGSITIMASLIPYEEAGVNQSPFVLVFDKIGVPYAADIMNFVVLTAVLSAANSGLYAATRMMWSLGNEGTLPKFIAYTTRKGVPFIALCLSMVGGLLALLASVVSAESLYVILVSVSGLAAMLVWVAAAACQLAFRRWYTSRGGRVEDLVYRTPLYPFVPWAALILSALSCILVVFDPGQRPALLYTIIFALVCYVGHWVAHKYKARGQP